MNSIHFDYSHFIIIINGSGSDSNCCIIWLNILYRNKPSDKANELNEARTHSIDNRPGWMGPTKPPSISRIVRTIVAWMEWVVGFVLKFRLHVYPFGVSFQLQNRLLLSSCGGWKRWQFTSSGGRPRVKGDCGRPASSNWWYAMYGQSGVIV